MSRFSEHYWIPTGELWEKRNLKFYLLTNYLLSTAFFLVKII